MSFKPQDIIYKDTFELKPSDGTRRIVDFFFHSRIAKNRDLLIVNRIVPKV